jgi:hypothetical protein
MAGYVLPAFGEFPRREAPPGMAAIASRVEVCQEGEMGDGLRATAQIYGGECVLCITGNLVPAEVYGIYNIMRKKPPRERSASDAATFNEMALPLGTDGRALVVSPCNEDLWRYVNHRCSGANLAIAAEDAADGTVLTFLVAVGDIEAGAFLSYNYNAVTDDQSEVRPKCLCDGGKCAKSLITYQQLSSVSVITGIRCMTDAVRLDLTDADRARLVALRLTGAGDTAPPWVLKFMALVAEQLLDVPLAFRFDGSQLLEGRVTNRLFTLRDAGQLMARVAEMMSALAEGDNPPLPVEVTCVKDGVDFKVMENGRVTISSINGPDTIHLKFDRRFLACCYVLYQNPHNSKTPEATMRRTLNECKGLKKHDSFHFHMPDAQTPKTPPAPEERAGKRCKTAE